MGLSVIFSAAVDPVGIEECCLQVLSGFDWPGRGAFGEEGILLLGLRPTTGHPLPDVGELEDGFCCC